MKAYVLTTGILFALLVLAHIWRAIIEPHLVRDPAFLGMSLLCVGLSGWSVAVYRRLPK